MRPLSRAWFRHRLEADPRRWVLFLAALEGFVGFAVKSSDRPVFFQSGVAVLIWLPFAALAPGLGVVAMMAHGRVLWWTGKLLGGRARPHEIHAAFAWASVPFLLAAIPLVVATALRAAARTLDPAPAGVQRVLDLLSASADALDILVVAGGMAGVALYAAFLAEAQGFGARRAIANHLLALLAGLAILVGGIAAGVWLIPGPKGFAGGLLGVAIAGTVAIAIEWSVRLASRRPARTAAPGVPRRL